MVMNQAQLASEIIAALGIEDTASAQTAWNKVAGVLINHMKNNVVVTVTGVETGGGTVSGTIE